MSRPLFLCVVVVVAACARNPEPMMIASGVLETEHVRAVMDAALRAVATGQPADSLYLVGATVVADGVPGSAPVRFAGVRAGGVATASGTSIEITPYLAWGVMEYRWLSSSGGQPALGRATFVLERVGGSWRIKHVHTSSLR